MATDPRRLFDAKDIQAAALYAKQVATDLADLYPVLADANGYLLVNVTTGTVSLSSTKVTIESSGLNVTLTSTAVTAALSSTLVTAHISPSASVVTVHISPSGSLATVSLSSTLVTISGNASVVGTKTNNSAAPGATNVGVLPAQANAATQSWTEGRQVALRTDLAGSLMTALTSTIVTTEISPSSTIVTVHISPSGSQATVSLSSTRVTANLISGQTSITGGVGAVANNSPRVVVVNDTGRTLTGATGSLSATFTTLFTPTNKAKVYGYAFTTTSASEVLVVVGDGAVANFKELWRVTLMAPSGASAGANLAIQPPGYLFATRSASAVTISLSTAVLIHYSLSFYDEA